MRIAVLRSLGALLACLFLAPSFHAQTTNLPLLRVLVRDGVGRAVAGASVSLADSTGAIVASGATDKLGRYQAALPAREYLLVAGKAGYATASQRVVPGGQAQLVLDIAPMQQDVVVAATGTPTPQTQLGQSVAVADRDKIEGLHALTADEILQTMPGVQIYSNGPTGGLSSALVRGGAAPFSAILLDGVPLQRLDFGAYDWSTLLPAALDSVTLVRGADSVVYGSAAASGVVDMRSVSGAGVAGPVLTLDSMAGSYGTDVETAQLTGDTGRFDYALTFGYLATRNQVPNNHDWNQTWAANFGYKLPTRSQLRLTLRRSDARAGQPNATEFFGVSDDSMQHQAETYDALRWEQAASPRWNSSLTVTQSEVNYAFDTLAQTGMPDGFGDTLGLPVTIVGANGYRVNGQAILDFAGTYPSHFASDSFGRYVNLQSAWSATRFLKVVAGYRYANEQAVSSPPLSWHSNGGFLELNGSGWNRLFASVGISDDNHSTFGNTFNPQTSLAFLPRLSRSGFWDETRLHANAATAQVDPTLSQEQSSLYATALASGGPALVNQLHLGAMAPQRAHTFDLGLDQYLWQDRVRAGVTLFDDRYDDLIEFVPTSGMPLLGITPAAAAATQAVGGAFLNSLRESSRGVEFEVQVRGRDGWYVESSYSYLRPVVLSSFSSDALYPSFNPAFPSIPIGAFSPLVGGRPFWVAPESGSVAGGIARGRWNVAARLTADSRRDGSTFLTDANFGTTMLLPNHDLAPAYAAVNLTSSYRQNARIEWEGAVDNLLGENYQTVFGYPSLGRAFRLGVRLTLLGAREP